MTTDSGFRQYATAVTPIGAITLEWLDRVFAQAAAEPPPRKDQVFLIPGSKLRQVQDNATRLLEWADQQPRGSWKAHWVRWLVTASGGGK